MTQDPLFCETLNDALDALVKACGGAKAVACRLWPEKTPEAAHRNLLACLNEGRVEKLSPEQVLYLLRMGRERNVHVAMDFIALDCGYRAQAVEPEDERAKLQREYIEATRAMARIADRMERVGGVVRAVA